MTPEEMHQKIYDIDRGLHLLHEMQAQTFAWLAAQLAGRCGDKEYVDMAVRDYYRRLDELDKNYGTAPEMPDVPDSSGPLNLN